MNDDPFDDIALSSELIERIVTVTPAKIKKRRKNFVVVPMIWYDALKTPTATGRTVLVAWYLCYLHWKNHSMPFTLANGMLSYDGISRQTKWRALRELERRGLITVKQRPKKSPIIHLHHMDVLQL